MENKRIFAVSDLHGQYDLYRQIKHFLNPMDIVYCLGDCGDRGPAGWKLIKTVINDPQFIYLKGNHEDMLVNAMKEYTKYDGIFDRDCHLLFSNGGQNTLEGWIHDGADMGWCGELKRLPNIKSYYNKQQDIGIILCHAGFTNCGNETPNEHDLLWDRKHIFDAPPENRSIVVHGHTTIIHLMDDLGIFGEEIEPQAFWYCNDHKVDIDMASAYTGAAVLLDLDTFDEHIFQV